MSRDGWLALASHFLGGPDHTDRTAHSQGDLQGDGGGRRGAEAGAWLETQGAAIQAGKIHGKQAEEREQQHGDGPLAGSGGRAQRPGVEDHHFTPGSRATPSRKELGAQRSPQGHWGWVPSPDALAPPRPEWPRRNTHPRGSQTLSQGCPAPHLRLLPECSPCTFLLLIFHF